MQVKSLLSVLLILLLGAPGTMAAQKPLGEKERQKRKRALEKELNRPFDKWEKEDVVYIITDEERAAFKRLQNAEEREKFIEIFWQMRDPTPETVENEYREEHHRRVTYANEHFSSGVPGWKTDRGRIYVLHGPPDQVESHAGGTYQRPPEEGSGSTPVFPFEKWRYRYIEGVGQDIEIEFVDKSMTGEYRLTIDPSEKDAGLHVPGVGPTWLEQLTGGDKRQRFSRTDGTHLGEGARYNQFERLQQFADLHRPPVRFKDLERVVTDINIRYNLMPFQMRADFIRISSETVLSALTFQLNLKDMSFEKKDGIQRAMVNIFGRVFNMTGKPVHTFEDVVQVDVPADQLGSALNQSRVYWQGLPLPPGRYRLSLVLKDVASGNMGTDSRLLHVPRYDDETLSASSLVLADQIARVETRQIGRGQFVIGSTKVRPSVTERFTRGQQLGIYLQVYNLATDEHGRPAAGIEYELLRDDRPVFHHAENSSQIAGASRQMTLEKSLPLAGLEPGRYKLQVKITDRIAKRTISPFATFTLQ